MIHRDQGTNFTFFLALVMIFFGQVALGGNKAPNTIAKPNLCWQLLSGNSDLTALNANASKPQEQYKQTTTRNINVYRNHFGEDFEAALSRLQSGDVHLDIGSGFGLASFSLTTEFPGVLSTAINTQNAWAFLERLPQNDRSPTPTQEPYAEQDSVYSEIVGNLGGNVNAIRIAFAMGVSSSDLRSTHGLSIGREGYEKPYFTPGFARDVLEKIRDAYVSVTTSGKVSYEVGFAENIIPTIPIEATFLTDVFGGYFYSINRVLLLEHYFDKLSPGGEAFIIIESSDLHESGTQTFGPKNQLIGSDKTFERHLVDRFPQIFSIQTHERRGLANSDITYLRITKPIGQVSIDLSSRYTVESYAYDQDHSVEIMREIPQLMIRQIP